MNKKQLNEAYKYARKNLDYNAMLRIIEVANLYHVKLKA